MGRGRGSMHIGPPAGSLKRILVRCYFLSAVQQMIESDLGPNFRALLGAEYSTGSALSRNLGMLVEPGRSMHNGSPVVERIPV